MSLCAICGKVLTSSESGRRPCCQARVHPKCIQGYANYCHNSGNPNPSCPVCKQQTEDLQSKGAHRDSILNTLRKSSGSASTGEGLAASTTNSTGSVSLGSPKSPALQSPKSPRIAQAEALIQKAEKRSAEKERQIADAERQIAEEHDRLKQINRNVAEHRSERSRSPAPESQTVAAFKKAIAVLEEKVSHLTAEANQKQSDFDKRLAHEISLRKELEQNFNSLADYSDQLQNQEKELSTLLEMEQNEHAACKSNLATAESKAAYLSAELEQLQKTNSANEALLSSAQGLSQQTEEFFQQQIGDLSYTLNSTRESLEKANNELSRSLEAQRYYEDRCTQLESSIAELEQLASQRDSNESLLNSTKSELNSLKDDYSDLQSQLAESRQEIMMLRDSTQESNSKVENLVEVNKELKLLNEELNEKLSETQYQFEQLLSSSQSFKEQIAAWDSDKERLEQLQTALSHIQKEYQLKCREVDEMKSAMSGVSDQHKSSIKDLQSEIKSLKQTVQRVEGQREEALAEQQNLRAELQSVKKNAEKLESMSKENGSLRKENADLKAELSAAQNSYEELEARYSHLLDAQADSQSNIASFRENEEKLESQLSLLQDELDKAKQLSAAKESDLEQRLSELSSLLNGSEETLRSAALTNTELDRQLNESLAEREQLQEALESQSGEVKMQLEEARFKIEDLSQANEELRLRLSESQTEFQSLLEQKEQLERDLTEATDSLRESSQQRADISDELTQLQKERDLVVLQHEEALKSVQAELDQALSLKADAENVNARLENVIEELRSDLEMARQSAEKELAMSELLNSELTDKIERFQEAIEKITEESRAEKERLQFALSDALGNYEESLQNLSLNDAKLCEAQEEIVRLNSALNHVCARLNESDAMLAERSAESDQLKGQLSEITMRFSAFLSEHEKLSRDSTKMLHMFERSDEERQALKDQLLHEHRRHKQLIELLSNSLSVHEVQFQSVQDELTSVKAALAKSLEHRAAVADQARSIEEMISIVDSQRIEMNKLQNDYSRVCALLEALEDNKSDHIQQMNAIVEQLRNKDSELEDLRVENSTLRQTVVELQGQIERDQKEYSAKKAALQEEFRQATDELLQTSPKNKSAAASNSASVKPSRDASPSLSRASTPAPSTADLMPSRVSAHAEAPLNRSSTAPAPNEFGSVSQNQPLLGRSATIPSADAQDGDHDGVIPVARQDSVASSRALSPVSSRNASRSPSPSRSNDAQPSALAPPVPASLPPQPLRPRPHPVPVRRMGPFVRRPPPPANASDPKPVVSGSPADQDRSGVDESSVSDTESSAPASGRPPAPSAAAAEVPVPERPGPPMRFRGAPGRPMSFRPQGMRPPPGPSRLLPPSGARPLGLDPSRSAPSPSSTSQSRSGTPPIVPVPSPRRPSVSRQSSSSSIDMSNVAKEQNAENDSESSRSISPDVQSESAAPSLPVSRFTPPGRPGSAPPSRPGSAPPSRPGSAPLRRMAPAPFRPGPAPNISSSESVGPASEPTTSPAVDTTKKDAEGDGNDRIRQPPNEPSRPVPVRPAQGRFGMMPRRAVPPPGRRMHNNPPSRAESAPSAPNRNAASHPPGSASTAMDLGRGRSRSPSPKPFSSVHHDISDPDRGTADSVSTPSLQDRSRSLNQPLSRNMQSDSQPKSKSLKVPSSSGSDDQEVKKVDFVFDRRSGSWVPEGSIGSDNDSASSVMNTVQRLRSQVHQTREEISNANAELPDSKSIATSSQSGIPEEKWIEACQLLIESRSRLPKDDPLHSRIDKFLADASSGTGPLPDAIAELEDLLQTVQIHDEKSSSSGSCGRFCSMFLLLSMLAAVAAFVLYTFYPQQANQAFESLEAFALRTMTSIKSAIAGSDGDIDDSVDIDDSGHAEL